MVRNHKYDSIIVGGGPAGLFAALELCRDSDLDVLLIEKGEDIDNRSNLVSGLGGAGAFSDGKLTLSSEIGGRLKDYLGENETQALITYVDGVYHGFGAPERLYGVGDEVYRLVQQASSVGLHLATIPVRHLGTERCRSIMKTMRDHLIPRLELQLNLAAAQVIVNDGRVSGIETETGDRFDCRYLVLAPGRDGADWLRTQSEKLNLTTHYNPVDIGVRVEVPATVLEKLTRVLYEAKLEYLSRSFQDRVRTFCMCPAGEVVSETTGGDDPVVIVNGQSYAHRQTDNTNFALLVSTNFAEPFHEPIAYGRYLARLANMLGGGVLVQRLGDLLAGRRSTSARIESGLVRPTLKNATPGDLSFILPYRILTGIVEMLQVMDRLAPGVASPDTLLYGVEVKFYSCRPELSPSLESEIGNLFSIGDGAGVSRGLIQASASGVVAAREILRRCGCRAPDRRLVSASR